MNQLATPEAKRFEEEFLERLREAFQGDPEGPSTDEFADEWLEELEDRCRRRVKIARIVGASVKNRELVLEECAKDPVAWVNDWVWTFDPRLVSIGEDPYLPFDLFMRQATVIRACELAEKYGRDFCILKGRDTGISYVVLAYMLHCWLFKPGWIGGVGTMTLDDLDSKDDPNSLLEKIRIMLRMLPSWMLPKGFDWRKHSVSKKLINPENGAVISGDIGPNMGRSGRTSFYLGDEFAHVFHASSIISALAYNSRATCFVSTPSPLGPANVFSQMCQGGKYQVIEVGWEHDPRRSVEWYENEKATRPPHTVAVELDRDLTGAAVGTLIPGSHVNACVKLYEELTAKPRAELRHLLAGQPVTAGLDPADGGANETALARRWGPMVDVLSGWLDKDTGESTEHAIGILSEKDEGLREEGELDLTELRYDEIGVGSGVRTTARKMREELEGQGDSLGFVFTPINVGLPATADFYPDDPEKAADERFANLRAELWWNLAVRAARTYRYVEKGDRTIALESLLAIPNDPVLKAQLCAPKKEFRVSKSHGTRIAIESKEKMKKRGIASPDRANALMMAFADSCSEEGDFWIGEF